MNEASIIQQLKNFASEIATYQYLQRERQQGTPSVDNLKLMTNFRSDALKGVGKFKPLITEIIGKEGATVRPKDGHPEYTVDVWLTGLKSTYDKDADSSIDKCLDLITVAIGRLEDDIRKGKRDTKTGESLARSVMFQSEPPKAFIAHEGETRALTMLKEFLEALGVQYFIAESKASNGRSIERQVDWTQSKADFAICLATKGKAINKKTGKHYMGLNVADELGRARQIYGKHIILLVQKGVEVHTNPREIVHETFTTTNMERAFIKITRELTNWGFITARTVTGASSSSNDTAPVTRQV
ncbi:MAG: nucleotide-binding protein [Dehalococcoidales bacterium]|nr:nucleotide-binding protein [Dehalococcoidales bacterium]